MFPKFVPRVGIGLAVLAAVHAHAAPAPVDTNALLLELQAIEDKQKQSTQGRLGSLAARFLEASRSNTTAERVYLEALRNLSFDSKTGDSNRFQDWKKDHKGLLDNKAFQAAMMLNLRYVALSLNAASKSNELPPFKEIMAYLRDLVAARQELGNGGLSGGDEQTLRELYEKPITDGVIAQGFLLKPELQQLTAGEGSKRKWEPASGAWRSILNLGVREPLRKLKDPSLLDTWQFQIDAERKGLEGNRSEVANTNFTQVDMPRLLWGQAQDLLVLGQKDKALTTMLGIIRTYPQHPDVINWIGQVRGVLEVDQKTSPAPTSPPASAPGT